MENCAAANKGYLMGPKHSLYKIWLYVENGFLLDGESESQRET